MSKKAGYGAYNKKGGGFIGKGKAHERDFLYREDAEEF